MWLAEAHEHDHSGHGLWEEYWGLLTDPAHLLFELTFSLAFDILVVAVLWGILVKKVIIPRLRRDIHKEIDAEHGITHDTKKEGDAPNETSPSSN